MFCPGCGKQLDEAAGVCSLCGAPTLRGVRHEPQSRKMSVKRLILGLTIFIFLLLVSGYFATEQRLTSYRNEHPVEPCSPEDEKAGRAGYVVLYAWAHSESSAPFWISFVEKRRLLSVREATLPISWRMRVGSEERCEEGEAVKNVALQTSGKQLYSRYAR